MGEPSAASPLTFFVSEPTALLATKARPPRALPGYVPRPRLVGRLDEGLPRGLIVVCAPAGFGKTALLTDWGRRGGRALAWLSLEPGDNDPARFWRYVTTALDRLYAGLAERLGALLGPPAPRSFEGLVTALINELAACGRYAEHEGEGNKDREVLLVLDDYHLIDSQPVHDSLGYLVEHLPPGLGVVVASRSDPPLGLARLRARGRLAEVRAAELPRSPDTCPEVTLDHQEGCPSCPHHTLQSSGAARSSWRAAVTHHRLSSPRIWGSAGRVCKIGSGRPTPTRTRVPSGRPARRKRSWLSCGAVISSWRWKMTFSGVRRRTSLGRTSSQSSVLAGP